MTWTRPTDSHSARRLLGPLELDRLNRYRYSADVRRFVAARALLRHEVARWMQVAPDAITLTTSCQRCGGDHGKLAVTVAGNRMPPEVSVSYGPDLVVVALSDAGPVGVDVEGRAAASFDRFDEIALHPLESASTAADRSRLWVRKESILKATGHGLTIDPRNLRITPSDEDPALLAWEAQERRPRSVWMFDLDLDPAHIGCVSVLGRRRPEFTVREEAPAGTPHTARR